MHRRIVARPTCDSRGSFTPGPPVGVEGLPGSGRPGLPPPAPQPAGAPLRDTFGECMGDVDLESGGERLQALAKRISDPAAARSVRSGLATATRPSRSIVDERFREGIVAKAPSGGAALSPPLRCWLLRATFRSCVAHAGTRVRHITSHARLVGSANAPVSMRAVRV